MEPIALNERMARWQILFSEFDIIYTSQKAVKGSAIVDFLASRALEDYEPLNFDFPNEEIVYVAVAEEDTIKGHFWKLNFDRASNAVGNGVGAVLAAIEHKIKVIEVYGDSALVIYQLRGEWETRDAKLINYRRLVLGLVEEFDDITFNYLLRDENQMADALATLASMIKVNRQEDVKPIQMNKAMENDKRTLRRLTCDYVLDGEILNEGEGKPYHASRPWISSPFFVEIEVEEGFRVEISPESTSTICEDGSVIREGDLTAPSINCDVESGGRMGVNP
ncbi:uncharacterized protein LOC108479432 [Gossypium arboreum]|uniref:uncharacterized protein LOC108479432 n=1 Tax=Gossypium arboreum TaxID=29729 RepID=UPI0008191135|nr:uncharacterized protein LOC108479432 [Gossypium arboreum]